MGAGGGSGEFFAVWFVSPGQAELRPFDLPPMSAGQVRIATRFTLVSTGTELAFLTGKHHEVASGKRAFPMGACGGYSNVGHIIDRADDVEQFRVGQRVLSMTGHANETICPVNSLAVTAIDEDITDEQASFGIVGSIALHGVRMGDVRMGHNVLVTGQGLIGQLTAQIAKLAGASQVYVTDRSRSRLEVSLETGATAGHCPDDTPATSWFPGPIHVAIETSGHPAGLLNCVEMVADEGTVVLLGCPHDPVSMDFYTHVQKRQLRIIGAYQPRCPTVSTAQYPWSQALNRRQIFRWIAEEKLDVDTLLNDVVRPDDVTGLYRRLIEQDATLAGGIDWRDWHRKSTKGHERG